MSEHTRPTVRASFALVLVVVYSLLCFCGCFHGVLEFTPSVNVGPSARSGGLRDFAWSYACRPEKVRTFRSTTSDLDDIVDIFRDNVNLVLDFRPDAAGARRCRVDAPVWGQACGYVPTGCIRTDPPDPEYPCEWQCWSVLDTETALDGPTVPILGNTSICLTVAQTAQIDGVDDPYFNTGDIYAWSAERLRPPNELANRNWPYANDRFPCELQPALNGCVPYGFRNMDACWVFRLLYSIDPGISVVNSRMYISNGDAVGGTDPQGLRGLPAMVCNSDWMAQWMQAADRAGPLGRTVPEGFVTSLGVEAGGERFLHDAPHWYLAAGDPEPDGWWWDRNADGSFNAAQDYLDGDDWATPGYGENATDRDFAYWNTMPGEPHEPRGAEYISRNDIASWGHFQCPLGRYGVEGVPDLATGWNPIYEVRHLTVGDKMYFAPNADASAFCGDPSSGSTVPMVGDAWRGNSRIGARWVDLGGRPALRLDVRLGAEVGLYARLLWAEMAAFVNGVDLAITIQPRVCDGLHGADFCVHKGGDGSCDRRLRDGPGGTVCGSEGWWDGFFPDAMPGERVRGGAIDQEKDWAGESDLGPEPLVLANNNLVLGLDVSASFDVDYAPLYCWDPIAAGLCAGIWAYAEGKLEDAATQQARTMFNTLARAVYYGMRDYATASPGEVGGCIECWLDGGTCNWCNLESGFAGAAHYIRRWFWQPATDRIPTFDGVTAGMGAEGLDTTRAPDSRTIKFTDVRWTSTAHDTVEFAFTGSSRESVQWMKG